MSSSNKNESDITYFEITTKEGHVFKTLSEIMYNLGGKDDILILMINKKGIFFHKSSNNKNIYNVCKLDRRNFTPFIFNNDDDKMNVIPLNIEEFYYKLKAVKKTEKIKLYLKKEETDVLFIDICNKENSKISTIKLKVLPLTEEVISFNEEKYSDDELTVTTQGGDFQNICKKMNQYTEFISIKAQTNGMWFHCMTEDNKEGEGDILGIFDKNKDNIYNEIFPSRYFHKLNKIGCLSKLVKIYAADNSKPLFINADAGCLGTFNTYIMQQKIDI